MTFYEARFPADYRGSIFAALHGSWNRAKRTGYKVIRAIVKGRRADRRVRGFRDRLRGRRPSVWGRPVGVAVDKDGALLVSEDGERHHLAHHLFRQGRER
jgi:glucose/arabinose dehydrogenase